MISRELGSAELASLQNALSRIPLSPKSNQGPLFESFFSSLMQALGCDSYSALDPETDRVIEFQGQFFKAECRYKTKSRLTAAEIREFIERVRSGPASIVGILATNSTATRTAPRYVLRATPHQVLIMDRDDIESLLSGQEGFADFLRRKNVAAAGGRFPGLDRAVSKPSHEDYSSALVATATPTFLVGGKPTPYITNRATGPLQERGARKLSSLGNSTFRGRGSNGGMEGLHILAFSAAVNIWRLAQLRLLRLPLFGIAVRHSKLPTIL